MISHEQMDAVLGDGAVVIGDDGKDLGRIGRVFEEASSDQPLWMTVTSDVWDGAEIVVPLALAQLDQGRVSVPYSADVVRTAPRDGVSEGVLGRRHAADLARHYGIGRSGDPGVAGHRTAAPAHTAHRSWQLLCTADSVRLLRRELRPFLDVTGLPGDELDDLVLAACEAATNAVEHSVAPATGVFDVSAVVDGTQVCITVRDHGRWRDPVPGPDSGRGLLLMRSLSALTITATPGGTTVTMENRSAAPGTWSFRRRR